MIKRYFLFILFILHFTFLIFHSSIAYAIEVGGHLTEDTTWSPNNNPYLVTETLIVDSGVILTILPGTEIKVSGASLTDYYEYLDNFWLHNGVSIAKYIRVDGRIIAEGTEQDSIVFTRLQDDPNFNWGSIYITNNAELCIFKYCIFEHMGNTGLAPGNISEGIDFYNGRGIIRNCSFLNFTYAISSGSHQKALEIIDNEFIINDDVNPYLPDFNYGKTMILSSRIGAYEDKDVLVCNNYFDGYGAYFGVGAEQLSFAYNTMTDFISNGGNRSYFFNNEFNDSADAIYGGDSLYIKNNRFISGGIYSDYAYVEISGNYFEGCDLDTGLECSGKIYNNTIYDGNVRTSAYLEVFQNIGYNGESGITITYRNESCYNNLSCNNEYAFDGAFSDCYNNCIFINNTEISQNGISGNPIFRNCILDFELPPECIDGGGNIIVDSLQVQSIFEDIQNGNFHLVSGSIAIDAGFDTLGYYYPFDIDYNHRVWDGDNNGAAIIDIGPYEFGSPSLGGIEGITYDPITGDFVDYVLIKINNEPGEFTFSDSIGSYQYKLPAGIYDVYAERVFYEDAIEYQIEVIDGQFTQLDIPMCETVYINEPIIPNSSLLTPNLSNYPNPFNPSTTISFSIPISNSVELSIYNIKGQHITTLINEHLTKGKHSFVWSGYDQNGHQVSSGIYFYKLKVGNKESVKRMLLLK